MEQYIGCDAHRRYSVFVVMDDKGQASNRFAWNMVGANCESTSVDCQLVPRWRSNRLAGGTG